jgi:hypothetical protein
MQRIGIEQIWSCGEYAANKLEVGRTLRSFSRLHDPPTRTVNLALASSQHLR